MLNTVGIKSTIKKEPFQMVFHIFSVLRVKLMSSCDEERLHNFEHSLEKNLETRKQPGQNYNTYICFFNMKTIHISQRQSFTLCKSLKSSAMFWWDNIPATEQVQAKQNIF